MGRVEAMQPLGEQADSAESRCPGLEVRAPIRLLPAQKQVDADMIGALALGEVDEAPQDPGRGAEVVTKAAPDCQVAVELMAKNATAAHRTPPRAGQGCAMERRPSMSSLA